MEKKVAGYIFGISLLLLFILALSEPVITGMSITIIKDNPIKLYAILAFVLAFSTVISGIAYHQAIDIVEAKRDANMKNLDGYIDHCLTNRRSEYSIRQELLAYGWAEQYIDNSFNFIRNDKKIIEFHNYSKYITRK